MQWTLVDLMHLRLIRDISFLSLFSTSFNVIRISLNAHRSSGYMDIFFTKRPGRIETVFVDFSKDTLMQLWLMRYQKLSVTLVKRKEAFHDQERERFKNC